MDGLKRPFIFQCCYQVILLAMMLSTGRALAETNYNLGIAPHFNASSTHLKWLPKLTNRTDITGNEALKQWVLDAFYVKGQ